MFKRIITFCLAIVMSVSLCACGNYSEKDLLEYEPQEFEITGLWIPHEISEEAFQTYKDAGFNVCSFTNHDEQPRSSENQYYLGSKRTMQVLEICKKIGIDVYIAYGNSWFVHNIEGDDYFGDTPFSKHDYYGEYKDIIKGVHINDEPNKEKMAELANDTLINDFKKVYPNAKYIVNLIPETAITSRNYTSYPEMLDHFGKGILSKFDNPYISVDCYLYSNSTAVGSNIINNYNQIAKCAKEYGAETTFILQSSTGKEFLPQLSEADIRQQAYLAIAFGADNLQYYCYSVPVGQVYDYCILNPDGTPSVIYDAVKNVNAEVQSFASAALAYNWNQSIGVSGTEDTTFRVCSIECDANFEKVNFTNAEKFVSATSTQDIVVSQFTSEKYGEAYMFVNFAENNGKTNTINAVFKDCGAVAIYGGEGYAGTPKIVKLDKNGNLAIELKYGEGVFVTPLA